MPIITSLSTRFFGHPRLTNPTFGMQSGPLACCETHNSTIVRVRGCADGALSTRGLPRLCLQRRVSGESLVDRYTKLEHAQNPVRGDGSAYVFQGVAANDAAQIENQVVGGFKNFRQSINCERDDQVCAARVTRRKKRGE